MAELLRGTLRAEHGLEFRESILGEIAVGRGEVFLVHHRVKGNLPCVLQELGQKILVDRLSRLVLCTGRHSADIAHCAGSGIHFHHIGHDRGGHGLIDQPSRQRDGHHHHSRQKKAQILVLDNDFSFPLVPLPCGSGRRAVRLVGRELFRLAEHPLNVHSEIPPVDFAS